MHKGKVKFQICISATLRANCFARNTAQRKIQLGNRRIAWIEHKSCVFCDKIRIIINSVWKHTLEYPQSCFVVVYWWWFWFLSVFFFFFLTCWWNIDKSTAVMFHFISSICEVIGTYFAFPSLSRVLEGILTSDTEPYSYTHAIVSKPAMAATLWRNSPVFQQVYLPLFIIILH